VIIPEIEPVEKQINAIWKRVDEARNIAIKAKALAEYLNKNVIEAILVSRQAKDAVDRIESKVDGLGDRIDKKMDHLRYWTIGLFVTFTSIVLAIKFLG
jgi:predicted  nucleic acid-binding Zn-ribbon protein